MDGWILSQNSRHTLPWHIVGQLESAKMRPCYGLQDELCEDSNPLQSLTFDGTKC